jgi:uncharacterized membrane protein
MTISIADQAEAKADSHDTLSKQGARAVMFVLLLAVLMALSAIFLILSYKGSQTAVAHRSYAAEAESSQPSKVV